jgi:drug/metabolite transporter (DMT)-like permease
MTPQERRGFWLGLLGVVIFSGTFPATHLAVATLDPIFIACGRAVAAALLAACALAIMRRPLPRGGQWRQLALIAGGVVFGFPILASWAMRYVPSSHGAIMAGILPLATALMGALRAGDRPSPGFWLAAAAGSALVVGFALWQGGGTLQLADLALLGAVAAAAVGYAEGARLTHELGGWETISWTLLIALPLSAGLAGYYMPADWDAIPAEAWTAFAYLAIMSQYVGFFAWYRGLALGGVARVSQTQLLQPFFTLVLAAMLIGETLTVATLGFAIAVVAVVAIGRAMPVRHRGEH